MTLNTYWNDKKKYTEFFCPHCSAHRRVSTKLKPGGFHYVQVGLTSLMLSLALWPIFEEKGLVCFIPLWMIFEIAFRIRVRGQIACSSCGFDPVLYMVDAEKAKQAIDDHWRAKFMEQKIPYRGLKSNPLKEPILPPGREEGAEGKAAKSSKATSEKRKEDSSTLSV